MVSHHALCCSTDHNIISQYVDVLQPDSFSPSSVWTIYWSSAAVCKSAHVNTRMWNSHQEKQNGYKKKFKKSRRETTGKHNDAKKKIPQRSTTVKTIQHKHKMTHNEYKQCFRLLWGAGSSTCRCPGAHGDIICLHGYEHGATWKWDSQKKPPATKSSQLFKSFYLKIHMIRRCRLKVAPAP